MIATCMRDKAKSNVHIASFKMKKYRKVKNTDISS